LNIYSATNGLSFTHNYSSVWRFFVDRLTCRRLSRTRVAVYRSD